LLEKAKPYRFYLDENEGMSIRLWRLKLVFYQPSRLQEEFRMLDFQLTQQESEALVR
jgi:hypothetical protein